MPCVQYSTFSSNSPQTGAAGFEPATLNSGCRRLNSDTPAVRALLRYRTTFCMSMLCRLSYATQKVVPPRRRTDRVCGVRSPQTLIVTGEKNRSVSYQIRHFCVNSRLLLVWDRSILCSYVCRILEYIFIPTPV